MSIRLRERVKALDLPPVLKSVLDALADHANDDGKECYPSEARICWETGWKRTAVITALAELHAKGLAVRHRPRDGRGGSYRYELSVDKGPFQKPFREFLLTFNKANKGTGDELFMEEERVRDATAKGTPRDPKGTGDDGKGTPDVPESSLAVNKPSNQPQEKTDGADGFLSKVSELFEEKTRKVLVLKKDEKAKFIDLQREYDSEVVLTAVGIHLREKDSFERMDYPASIFLGNPDGFIKRAVKKSAEAKAKAQRFNFRETFRERTGREREFTPEERNTLKQLVRDHGRDSVWTHWLKFLENLDVNSLPDYPVEDFVQQFLVSIHTVP